MVELGTRAVVLTPGHQVYLTQAEESRHFDILTFVCLPDCLVFGLSIMDIFTYHFSSVVIVATCVVISSMDEVRQTALGPMHFITLSGCLKVRNMKSKF